MIADMAAQARKKRSKTGCFTCRQRKVRCDEQHPICGACLRLTLPCSFPVSADEAMRPRAVEDVDEAPRRKRQHTMRDGVGGQTNSHGAHGIHDTHARGVHGARAVHPIADASMRVGTPLGPSPTAHGRANRHAAHHMSFSAKSTSPTLYPSSCSLDGGVDDLSSVAEYQQLSTSWWSSLGEGLLDVNWLECWVPELDDQFYDYCEYGISLRPGSDTAAQLPTAARNPGRHLVPGASKPATGPASAATARSASVTTAKSTATPAASSSAGKCRRHASLQRSVTLLPEDRPLLQHFTTTMVRFCILRNCVHDNLYSYILLNMGLFHSTLFDSMMAWSALHLAHVQKKSNQDARARYDRAYTALIEDLGHGVAPGLLLASTWFLLQYQLILAESVESFCELIDMAAEVARGELQNGDPEHAMNRIGPVGSLVLVWMSARDSQVAYLGLGGRLLGCLKTYPNIYELVDASSVRNGDDPNGGSGSDGIEGRDGTTSPADGCASGSPLAEIVFMERAQITGRAKPSEMQTCMKLSFQNVTVAGQIKFLGRSEMHHNKMGVHVNDRGAWETIRASLGLLRRDIEQEDTEPARAALGVATGSLTAMPRVEPIHYNRLLLLAGYYTTQIQYHNFRPRNTYNKGDSNDPELLSREECADRMIRLCQRVETARPNSPQGIWPTQVLIAGITTRDPIYQAWAIHCFEKAERWGAHIVKARMLLDAVVRHQNATGKRANLIEVMKKTTGIFVF